MRNCKLYMIDIWSEKINKYNILVLIEKDVKVFFNYVE